jgi:hypothetical protein
MRRLSLKRLAATRAVEAVARLKLRLALRAARARALAPPPMAGDSDKAPRLRLLN